ncbi:MAG: site-2 protease family protein [bacterium]|nr:site-2 protease family protein [bacterium]
MSTEPTRRYTAEDFLLATAPREIEPEVAAAPPNRRRLGRLAIWLAIATIFSTFWAGVVAWEPFGLIGPSMTLGSMMPFRQALLANWLGGLQFALALMAILVAHELGHYILTIIYRVPSTPPLFIPFPFISPIGTMGAVILMQSGTADRKQIFDIGLAGPLAGLIVAFPITVIGILYAEPIRYAPSESLFIGQPLLIQWLAGWLVPEQAGDFVRIANTQASPFLMASWVGLLVTGINMMPLGQLDGGHVTFGLLGPRSYWVAIAALATAIAYMLVTQVVMFALMLLLVYLMGLKHPPSSNDDRSLGWPRQVIGWLSLTLPILCIPARPLEVI